MFVCPPVYTLCVFVCLFASFASGRGGGGGGEGGKGIKSAIGGGVRGRSE